ncbi:hypothetical protein L1987_48903 [Smallanthus sonchifolius]|uniref:Uncharacterized protein n=1 Tax=Smallanthus sonchifolius TaxID=185202 RepID=A0ACB9FTR5_9ASTR|nr:hypothetical protein L1987_48903 [Smallanthus sonchifolius]
MLGEARHRPLLVAPVRFLLLGVWQLLLQKVFGSTMSVWVDNTDANTKTMAGRGGAGRRGGRTGRVSRLPLNRRRNEEESVHVEHKESVHVECTESVHKTNVTPPGDGNEGSLCLEPEVRDLIAREKSKEEEEENPDEKVYDSDGDEVNVGLTTRGCTYKGFKDGDPPKFDGNKDLVATFEWIERMNGVINISECRPDQVVKFVAHSFTNEALSWWRNIQRSKSPNAQKKDDMGRPKEADDPKVLPPE